MRTTNFVVLAVLSLSFATAYAQNEERVLNSAPINVDGYLSEEKPVTDGELEQIKHEIKKQKNEVHLNKEKTKGFKELTKTTEKLSETTEEYIEEKKDAQKEIAEYNAKIKCLMEENAGPDCDKYKKADRQEITQEVGVAQAAPAITSAAEINDLPTGKPFERIKLLPFAGGTTFNGAKEQLDAELAGGLRLESNITSRFSVGIGLNYSQLKTQDYANSIYGGYGGGGYMGAYGNSGRQINYKSMGMDLYGKFFITQGERFRPYLGAGLGYNRATLQYSQNNPYSYSTAGYGYSFGNEAYKTSFATGRLMAGTEIMITRGFGINLEAGYASGIGDSLSSQNSKNPFNSPDQRRLKTLGSDIINSNQISIFAGAVILF